MQPMIDDRLRSQILKSKRVLAEIQATAQSKALPIAQVEREAGKILDNMVRIIASAEAATGPLGDLVISDY